jgi:hypothetical protein
VLAQVESKKLIVTGKERRESRSLRLVAGIHGGKFYPNAERPLQIKKVAFNIVLRYYRRGSSWNHAPY